MRVKDKRKTDFTREELLDILDSFLEYKPAFDKSVKNKDISSDTAVTRLIRLLIDYGILDRDYFHNLEVISEKYGKKSILDLSTVKLNFLEIITILTFIYRRDYLEGGLARFKFIEDNTFYNLLCRLEEIKNEL